MYVCDVSNPVYIFKVDSLSSEHGICQVSIINDNYLAMSEWTEGFSLMDNSDPMNIEEILHQDTPATAWCSIWDQRFLYVCDQYDLIIYDLFNYAGVEDLPTGYVPQDYAVLHPVIPDPFNSQAKISFELRKGSKINLAIYNIFGEEVEILINNSYYKPGNYQRSFDGKDLSSGIYFVSLEYGDNRLIQKIILLK